MKSKTRFFYLFTDKLPFIEWSLRILCLSLLYNRIISLFPVPSIIQLEHIQWEQKLLVKLVNIMFTKIFKKSDYFLVIKA